MAENITAWCMKCKKKVDMKNPIVNKTKRGTPMTKGICSICSTNICKLGK